MSNLASPRRTDRWLDGSSAAPELHPLRVAWLPPCCSAGVLSGQPGRAGHAPAILSCSPQMQLFSSISSHHHLRPRGLASGTALEHSLLASWTVSDSPSLPPLPLPECSSPINLAFPVSWLQTPLTTHHSSIFCLEAPPSSSYNQEALGQCVKGGSYGWDQISEFKTPLSSP